MLFDTNGIYFIDDYSNDYDFAVDIINGTIENRPIKKFVKDTKVFNLEDALKYGNAFPKLYDPYKGYKQTDLRAENAKEQALLEIQMLEFSINDLNLYLDIHPEDKEMFSLFKNYVGMCKEKKKAYSQIYGPLTLDDVSEEYEWSKGVWPWEEGMM